MKSSGKRLGFRLGIEPIYSPSEAFLFEGFTVSVDRFVVVVFLMRCWNAIPDFSKNEINRERPFFHRIAEFSLTVAFFATAHFPKDGFAATPRPIQKLNTNAKATTIIKCA